MAREQIHCPLCGWLAVESRHPKRSEMIGARIILLNHLNVYHLSEIANRAATVGQG